MSTETTQEQFEGWVILELMGHRKLGGYLTEKEIGGAAFLRIDVPREAAHPGEEDTPQATQFYSSAAVYCITPTTEAIARALANRYQPDPVTRWELPALEPPRDVQDVEYDDPTDHDSGDPFADE